MLSFRLLSLLLLVLAASPAQAHKPSDAYLSIVADSARVTGQLDIALRDLDHAIGLDADGDGLITWGETRARAEAITAYAFSRLALEADGAACAILASELLVDRHSDGAYAALPFAAQCADSPRRLDVAYRLFAEIDPQHKGLLRLTGKDVTQTAVFGVDAPRRSFDVARAGVLRQFFDYLASGVEHIWRGYDHILFLLSLLLPAAAARVAGRWTPQQSFRDALLDVTKIVTAFTIAHSITLALASLQIVALPSRLTESAIAASVVVAALNNIYPLIEGRRWAVAGAFGLVHGFGFASVLIDLGLPGASMTLALAGFNLGVEAGQLSIVAVFLPLAWALRATWLYRRAGIVAGSWAIVGVAAIWFVERAFDIGLIPA
jgi:hypothetical protein